MRKSAWAGLGFLLAGGTAWPQTYLISTVAGGGVPFTPAAASGVGLAPPVGTAADAFGNVYFSSGNLVFKVDGSGILTRVAGNGKAGYSGDSGAATEAQLNLPQGVAVDGSGTLYIADTGNNAVRRVTPDGVIVTLVGATAKSVQLNAPQGVAIDAAGNLYVSDTKNSVIRQVTSAGAITTVAGNGTRGFSGDGGAATSAQLNLPAGIAVDAAGRLYIADSGNSVVRRVTAGGSIATVAGTGGVSGYFGDGQKATIAQLNAPSSVAFDTAGNLYLCDSGNNTIRRVGLDGTIATVAGNGTVGFSGDGGAATSAQLWSPWGVATDLNGDVLIADYYNYRVRRIAPDGTISTLAGNGAGGYHGDGGPATSSQLFQPMAVAVDTARNYYIADTFGNSVRKVTPDGTITTLAGAAGVRGYAGDGGPAATALLNRPRGVLADSSGNIYISDSDNERVREITASTGNIATVAGTGTAGYSGNGALAIDGQVTSPCGLALDSTLDLFIADFGNNVIREITVNNSYIVFAAGVYNPGYYGDGAGATSAYLNSPSSVAMDSAGNTYIADSYNNAIRKVDTAGIITTVAGNGTAGYTGDGGPATSAQLFQPWGVAVDASGNLFIGDTGNNAIREVSASGTIATVAGGHGAGYSGDGSAALSAQLNGPAGVAVDSAGNVYIADSNNNAIRVLTPATSHAVLRVTATHAGFFQPGQTGAAFSVVVSNATGSAATSGAVTATVTLSTGLALGSMSGPGWSCSANACSRSDALGGGSSYPAIAVTASVGAGTASPAAIQVAAAGGGSFPASASDAAAILGPPAAPLPVTPANGVGAVSPLAVLRWGSTGATSYQVYFGTSSAPPLVATTAAAGYSPGTLNGGTTYYWQIVAQNSLGTTPSPVWSFTTGFSVAGLQFVAVAPCRVVDTRTAAGAFGGPALLAGSTRSFAIPLGACNIPSAAQAYSLNVTAVPQAPVPFLTLWPAGLPQPAVSTLNSWDGTVTANAALVPAGSAGAVSVYVSGTTDLILDINGYFVAGSGASFYALTPCRIADTRFPTGPFGGPSLYAGQTRDFPLPSGTCGLPPGASSYSLNVTAVPDPTVDFLGYLTAWATGQPQPVASTLNSWTGTVVANAALVPAGTNGSISVFVTNPTDVVLDTNGYFAAPGNAGALSFYPMAPCRVVDTRGLPGPFGAPEMQAGERRSFSIPASGCYVPPGAAAYSLNFTVVPDGALSYLIAWPAGSAIPVVSTLNALDGSVVANAAIVPAGAGGAISVYTSNPTQVIVDINGYFAP